MPRKGGVVKRGVLPDLKYNDTMVSRFINGLMKKGKKSVAQRIFYQALDIVGQKSQDEPLKVFHQAMDNVRPLIEVKSRRVGGATYQVPVEVRADRRISLAIRWLIGYAKSRAEKSMEAKLAAELLDHRIDQTVARRQQHQQDAEHDDPGKEVRQIDRGLDDRPEALEPRLVERDRQNDRRRNAQEQLGEAEENGVEHQLVEVKRVDERVEVRQAVPRAAPHAQQRLEAFECDLRVQQGPIAEDRKIQQ